MIVSTHKPNRVYTEEELHWCAGVAACRAAIAAGVVNPAHPFRSQRHELANASAEFKRGYKLEFIASKPR